MKTRKHKILLLAATMGACLTIPAADASVITIAPGNVTASSEIGDTFNREDDFIVDGSGLTAGQHTTAVEFNMWLSSGDSFGGIDTDPSVTFDLGAVYRINSFHVWNYNEFDEATQANLTSRGVNSVSVEYGTTVGLGSTVAGITTFAQADGTATYAGEDFSSFTPFDARYIKFDINSNHGDASSFYGLSEVQFDGIAIPEPSTLALLTAGLGALIAVRRRKIRTTA